MQNPASGNLSKHTNPNALHQWLLQRFHERVGDLVGDALLPAGAPVQATGILDVGCGEGFVLRHLVRRFPTLAPRGIDARAQALTWARRQGPHTASWVLGDAAQLPFADRSFPVVLCLEVLEHLDRPWSALEELRRVCSGSLIVSVPNQPFFAAANLLRGKNLSTAGEDPDHRSHWRGATFLRELRRRLVVERVTYSFPWVIATARTGRGDDA